MPNNPIEYFSSRPQVNREAARQALGIDGAALNDLLETHGYERNLALGLKRYSKRAQDKAITSYLVGSEVNPCFWETFLNYCAVNDCEPVVIPLRYRNPTALEEAVAQDSDTYFAPEIIKCICSDRFEFGMTRILADVKINPTNLQPLNTLLPFSYGKHIVVGHSTQQIVSLTTGRGERTLTAWSTGSCSVPELSDSLAGKKAELHHRLGFVRLGENSIRSVHACRDGTFIDSGFEYSGTDRHPVAPELCVMGDIHYGHHDPLALKWALAQAKSLGCKKLYLNDSFDGSTCNPHVPQLHKRTEIFDFVSEELSYHAAQMASIVDQGFHPELVHSNHTDFLTRWASGTDRGLVHRKDLEVFDALQEPGFDLSLILGASTLPTDHIEQSYRIVHGHERFNGARGSIRSYTQTGTRTVFGHTHTIASLLGHENVGCLCKLEQEYNSGFSGWSHSIGFAYHNRKFQHSVFWG